MSPGSPATVQTDPISLSRRLRRRGVFEAEHYRSSLRRRQEVTNARERGDGYWQQQRQGLMPDVGYNCGKKGEQRRADVCWLLGISDPRNVR
jgi:hypothetical protein